MGKKVFMMFVVLSTLINFDASEVSSSTDKSEIIATSEAVLENDTEVASSSVLSEVSNTKEESSEIEEKMSKMVKIKRKKLKLPILKQQHKKQRKIQRQ